MQMHSPLSTSLSQLERLTSRVDDLEAKLSYCGSKMDSLLSECVCVCECVYVSVCVCECVYVSVCVCECE